MKKIITIRDIIDYVSNHTTVFLTTPDQTKHEVLVSGQIENLYTFNTGRSGMPLYIDSGSIEEMFHENGDIYLQTKDGIWVLHAEEDIFDFDLSDKEILKQHEVLACVKRARKLEAYLNEQLYLILLDHAMIFIDFKIDVKYVCDVRRFGRIELVTEPCFSYYYDVFIKDTHNDVVYVKDMQLDIDITIEEAFRHLARDLFKKLLPADIVLMLDGLANLRSDENGDTELNPTAINDTESA